MAQCGTCQGAGKIYEEKQMSVYSWKTKTTYTETVITEKNCPAGCNNGHIPDTGSR
jgi:hypothetical protein